MKKLLLTALAVFALTSMNAQEEEIRFGAKAGLNLSNINGDETDDNKMRASFHVGAVVEVPLTDKFALQPEILYSSQGTRFEESNEFFEADVTTKLDYLLIPIIAKYYIAEGFSIHAGPQIGILVSAKAEGKITSSDVATDIDEDIKDDLNTLDLGVNFGVGYQLDMGLFFEGRYNLGLSNTIKDADDFKQTNAVIQFSVGYKF